MSMGVLAMDIVIVIDGDSEDERHNASSRPSCEGFLGHLRAIVSHCQPIVEGRLCVRNTVYLHVPNLA